MLPLRYGVKGSGAEEGKWNQEKATRSETGAWAPSKSNSNAWAACPATGRSKRDSSTACPGASRMNKSAGHSARNDGQSKTARRRARREPSGDWRFRERQRRGPFVRGGWWTTRQVSSPGTMYRAPAKAGVNWEAGDPRSGKSQVPPKRSGM